MRELFKAFTTNDVLDYEGAMIARVSYKKEKKNLKSLKYSNEIVRQSKRLCIIKCNGSFKNEMVETLTVYLMMNPKLSNNVNEGTLKGELWCTFSVDDIKAFSYETGDYNSIHLTDNPVVQGLYILERIREKTDASQIDLKFMNPIYGMKSVYLNMKDNDILGISNGVECFKATVF